MKLLQLEVAGYRSLKDVSWCPGGLNVVIGPNASGKSNLLRMLEMLSTAAEGGLGRYVQRQGGMEPMVWDGEAKNIHFKIKMTPLPPYSDPQTDAFTYQLDLARLGTSSSYRIDHEVLGNYCAVEKGEAKEAWKLLERRAGHGIVFSVDAQRFESIPTETSTTTTPHPSDKPLEASTDSLSEEETLLSSSAGPFAANRFVAGFQGELANWKIYHDVATHAEAPLRAPQVTRAETQVNSDGQNLVSVLHTLYARDRKFEEDINNAMFAAFGRDFEKLTFPPAADQRIQLRLRWRSLKREQSAADLSDGTLRFLFLLAVLANPSPPALIAIDEPETGLHPSMLPIVAEYARDASARTQVVLTTHSAELLDAFGEEAPTTTVVEREDGQTQLRVISDDELAYWLKQYTLGELYRSKELEAMK